MIPGAGIIIVLLVIWILVLYDKLGDVEMQLNQIHRDEMDRARREHSRVHGN